MNWKDTLSALVETNPDLKADASFVESTANKSESKKQTKQTLRVELDKRKGKLATLITEFECSDEVVKELAKRLKSQLAVGGSVRDGEILLQGDVRQKVVALLEKENYKVRRIGF